MKILVVTWIGWLTAMGAPNPAFGSQADQFAQVPAEAVKALLAGQWERAAAGLDDELCARSPLARLLKAHAYLALNKNNDSLCLFLSVSSRGDLDSYRSWSEALAQRSPDNPIACYLRADALARLEKFDQAVAVLTHGVKGGEAPGLLLNARGVAYAKQGRLDEARKDFEAAIRVSPTLADAYSNLGHYWIQRKEGAQGAVKAFDKALALVPDFALAKFGKACVEIALKRETAEKHIEEAVASLSCPAARALLEESVLRMLAAASGADPEELIAEAREPGTTLRREYQSGSRAALEASANRWSNATARLGLPSDGLFERLALNRAAEWVRQLGETWGPQAVTQWAARNPRVAERVLRHYNAQIVPTNEAARQTGAGGGVAVSLLSFPLRVSSERWLAARQWLPDAINRGLQQPQKEASPGGVDVNVAQISWDEGKWPFDPVYGLCYGTITRVQQPPKADTQPQPGDGK